MYRLIGICTNKCFFLFPSLSRKDSSPIWHQFRALMGVKAPIRPLGCWVDTELRLGMRAALPTASVPTALQVRCWFCQRLLSLLGNWTYQKPTKNLLYLCADKLTKLTVQCVFLGQNLRGKRKESNCSTWPKAYEVDCIVRLLCRLFECKNDIVKNVAGRTSKR